VVSDAPNCGHLTSAICVAPEVFAAQELWRLDGSTAAFDILAAVTFVGIRKLLGQISPESSARFEGTPEVLLCHHTLIAFANLAGYARE